MLSFALIACLLSVTALPVAARTTYKPQINWVDCSKNVPDSSVSPYFNASSYDLTNLPSTLHCGRLDVPMDYTKPFCETNKITLGLAMYRPLKPQGVIFFNPGGTDAGVIIAWEVALNYSNAFEGLLDFDLLMIDVRGTYSSNQLNVSPDAFAGLNGPYPTNQSQYDAVKNASAATIQSWIDLSTPPGIIEHVGTTENVQDYESIRQALGYEKINFLGASYGSFRAAQYAHKYPHHVENFVLDAVAPHGYPLFDQSQDNIRATDRQMLRIDAYCLNDPKCHFYSQGKGSIQKAFNQVLSAAPYIVDGSPLEAFDIRSAMLNQLLGSPDYPMIAEGLYNATKGDASFFVEPQPTSLDTFIAGVVSQPLLCNDYEYERTYEAFKKSLDAGLKNDQTGIGMTQTWTIQLACSAWPFKVQEAEKHAFELSKNLLLVTSDFDASAPTEWATYAWKHAPHSALVVRHGDDHVSFPLTTQPSTLISKAFLRNGTVPAAQESEQVSVYTPGMVRKPVSDPYQVVTGALAGDVDSGTVVEIPFRKRGNVIGVLRWGAR